MARRAALKQRAAARRALAPSKNAADTGGTALRLLPIAWGGGPRSGGGALAGALAENERVQFSDIRVAWDTSWRHMEREQI